MFPEAENQQLRALVAERDARVAELLLENEDLRVRLRAAAEAAARLERDLQRLRRQVVGPSSERLVDQVSPPTTAPEPDSIEPAKPPSKRFKTGRKKNRRRDIAKMNHLETRTFRSSVADRGCPCCGKPMKAVGEEVSWRLERIPARTIRHKVVLEKLACPDHPEAGVVTAPSPSYALPKAMCGNELLAQVVIDKYTDHLPLYRQADRFRREGLDLSRSTLCGWMMAIADLLRPIHRQLALQVLGGRWLRADATGLPVLDNKVKGRAHHGHLWAWGNYEIVVFNYTSDKKAETVAALFDGFTGTVLIDGASDFNLLEKTEGVERAGCWAHARRKFYEALPYDADRALLALTMIRELFLAERIVMAADQEQRLALRQELCQPIIDGFRTWLDEIWPSLVPRSPMHAAVQYVRNQWDRLIVFLHTAEIACHNNDTERDLRRPVKGRHNYLFAGSPRGAEAAAIFYTLVGTCLLQAIDPRAYLVDVLGRLDEPPSQLTPPAIREQWAARPRGDPAT